MKVRVGVAGGVIVAHMAHRAPLPSDAGGWKLIVCAEALGTGRSRGGFTAVGLGAPLGCVYARLIPCLHTRSPIGIPASPSFRMPTI